MTEEATGIRIRPQEIDIPKNDPFENDLLGRKEPIEILTRLVRTLEGPTVLAVDASWGNGKSTFVRIWAEYLRKRGFPTVEFNAWKTDYTRDPFSALSSELMEGLGGTNADDPIAEKLAKLKEAGKEVLRRSVPGVVRLATAGILDISPLLEQELGQVLASFAEKRLTEYVETQNSVRKFNAALKDAAKTLSASHEDRPLVIFVDELDRCRPSYSIELLEIAKHFFAVDHIVFVLAVNRAELANSIKGQYGSEFDASGYLRRFIDIDFRLPDPDRRAFVSSIIAHTGLDESSQLRIGTSMAAHTSMGGILLAFFSLPILSLRRIAQAIHRLCLIFSVKGIDSELEWLAVTTALILRTIDPELYYSFFRGDTTDLDAANTLFSKPEMNALRRSSEGVLFETMLIVAFHEFSARKLKWLKKKDQAILSPLHSHYKGGPGLKRSEEVESHAQNVLSSVEEYRAYIEKAKKMQGDVFKVAVELLELFSNHLVDERSD